MAGKSGFSAYPKHLGRKGKGYVVCQASGMLRKASHMVDDVRQGRVAREFADITPGFGTNHPQDRVQLGELDDPKPIYQARPQDKRNLSKSDLGYSDAEIKLSIQEGRPPRFGY